MILSKTVLRICSIAMTEAVSLAALGSQSVHFCRAVCSLLAFFVSALASLLSRRHCLMCASTTKAQDLTAFIRPSHASQVTLIRSAFTSAAVAVPSRRRWSRWASATDLPAYHLSYCGAGGGASSALSMAANRAWSSEGWRCQSAHEPLECFAPTSFRLRRALPFSPCFSFV